MLPVHSLKPRGLRVWSLTYFGKTELLSNTKQGNKAQASIEFSGEHEKEGKEKSRHLSFKKAKLVKEFPMIKSEDKCDSVVCDKFTFDERK